ncbi:MAG: UDP-N-acetylglucosamine--N-acetylmuramyl-(pentapeptide) pyrophosphoryl-undecaprenol N-acetylglucosamine transferase [Patescibacteria group bacterium]|nr:UDP-N-acetylglucosamine--N-acetylmuramyl-(pentapeptide) pyrophosphoryl-undecaprenol N-acetylglucosamine transferase [Patescibacteria group bacterium]MDD4611254.1 UDP-N-acetylglucosamine--N-acetylmuramyl-(pentapeptide) pyrophosphoryl-undecaprenol N-acetylglucosamine transferase [Patescibacteria group bacterium]
MSGKNTKKILLTGGGTGGSVSPLLAMAEELAAGRSRVLPRSYDFLFVGTKKGPEREMAATAGIEFKAITSGKLRRYWSWHNFIDPFKILIGFFYAFFIIIKWRPNLIISAGAFVSVPVVWAGWLYRVPILIHQQDVRPGLANKLMAPFARVITVTFAKSLKDYGKKAVWTGNLIRQGFIACHSELVPVATGTGEESRQAIRTRFFGLRPQNDNPIVLVVGGGTGAVAINHLVRESLDELLKYCLIIHLAGKNKIPNPKSQIPNKFQNSNYNPQNYKVYDFLNVNEMAAALKIADVVISRCGMNFLTELSYLGKPAILIPISDSHQEDNAKIMAEKDAAIVLNQKNLTPKIFQSKIKELLEDKNLQNKLSGNIKKVIKIGNGKIVEIVKDLI